jgi:polyphosphate kinase
MIRVAGLKQQLSGHVADTGPDAMMPAEQRQAVARRCHALVERQDRIFVEEVLPGLERAGVRLFRGPALSPQANAAACAPEFPA